MKTILREGFFWFVCLFVDKNGSHWQFVKTKVLHSVPQLECRIARHCAQLFLFWPPDAREAPVKEAGESWELDFFGVAGVNPQTHSVSGVLSALSSTNSAFSSSSFKGNIRRSHGDQSCQRTQEEII